jgi:hypothetical protein
MAAIILVALRKSLRVWSMAYAPFYDICFPPYEVGGIALCSRTALYNDLEGEAIVLVYLPGICRGI